MAIRSTCIGRWSSPTWDDDWTYIDWVLIYLIVVAHYIIIPDLRTTFGALGAPPLPG